MNMSTNAVEADLMSSIKLNKARGVSQIHGVTCDTDVVTQPKQTFAPYSFKQGVYFIGRDALLKLSKDDCERVLCFLTMDTTDVDPEGNETVWYANKVRLLHYYDRDRNHVMMSTSEVKKEVVPWQGARCVCGTPHYIYSLS